jgi:hypothetical protein
MVDPNALTRLGSGLRTACWTTPPSPSKLKTSRHGWQSWRGLRKRPRGAGEMVRRSGRANILRRIEGLEARSVDGSGLTLHSSAWLAFWQQQVHAYETGQKHAPLTLEGVRAVMQATPDDDCGDDSQRLQRVEWACR